MFQQPGEDGQLHFRWWSPSLSVAFFISFLFPLPSPDSPFPLAPLPSRSVWMVRLKQQPCCGWSNGTKSGVSVRFGPLQPATASAHSGVEAKAQRCCRVRTVESSSVLFYFHQCLVVSCSTMYGNKRLMTPCTTISVNSLPFKSHFSCTTDGITAWTILEFII